MPESVDQHHGAGDAPVAGPQFVDAGASGKRTPDGRGRVERVGCYAL